MKRKTTSLLLWSVLLAGCTTSPQPFPMPLAPPDPKAILVSDPEGAKPVVTTGLPGAVVVSEEDLEVVLSVAPHSQRERGPVFADGSFSIRLAALLDGDRVEAWVERGDQRSTPVVVGWRDLPSDNDPAIIVTVAPVQGGQAAVSGTFASGWQIVIGNPRLGAAAAATVDGSGSFSTSIAAAPGDRLDFFGRNLTNEDTTPAGETTVPP